jgi:3D (Asp-Asp-Asp) domain-containing protein
MRNEATTSLFRPAALGLVMTCSLLSGCKSKSAATDERASGTNGVAPSAGVAGAAAAAAPGAAAPSSAGKCPAGRWSYDYSDQALETLMKNVGGAKVLKKEGSFVCTVSDGQEGTVACETQGKPVENIVETNQTGMKMIISITIDGKASTRFKLIDTQNMRVVSSDTSKLKIGTQVTVAGQKVPFPADKMVSIFGKPESTLGYKCEDGKLFLKPHIDNVDTPWQRLEPAK